MKTLFLILALCFLLSCREGQRFSFEAPEPMDFTTYAEYVEHDTIFIHDTLYLNARLETAINK